ncbi:LysR family transcriptional regulator [Arhodomonas aquaeolei]|uniref:LysR family transcriptional regulator n=2 Tax=Arhodomonas TaxID=2368 RepID=UPI00037AE7C9|nr:LysR substrate-binding domain-containing protein [Arhodomonas aquaeolei]
MDIRQLRYFAAIADAGSITRAAEQLDVAQPALSQHVRQLEEELGTQLLVRSVRGVRLTETGTRLLGHARKLLSDFQAIRDDIQDTEARPAGPTHIGIPTSLGMLLSVPLALQVRRELPEVQLRIAEGLSGHTLEWLRQGNLDLALVFGAETVSGLAMELIATEELHVVGPAGDERLSALTSGPEGNLPLSALDGLPLIMPGRPHGVREELEAAVRRRAVGLDIVLEMDALEPIKALVAEGAGYTVLSPRLARHGSVGAGLQTYPIRDPEIQRSIYLARVADRPLSIAARHVRDRLRTLLATLTEGRRWRTDLTA